MRLQQLAPGVLGHSEDMADNNKIVNQLRALVLLTKTEEQVARTRISQARTDAVRRELTQNADNAAARTIEITEALRSLGGVPDVVTPALGRLSASLKATFEQAAPFEEALLSDLSLEHQLLDRATYVKVLAEQAEETQVRRLAEKLIGAHQATVEWLTVVLAEEALGGPAALVATPVQKVAGGVARAVNAPVRLWANTVNNAVDTVKHAGEETSDRVSAVTDRAAQLTEAATGHGDSERARGRTEGPHPDERGVDPPSVLRDQASTPTASLASEASWVCAALTTFARLLWVSS